MGLFTAGIAELHALIEVMSQSFRWEDQAGSLVAIKTILEHDPQLLSDENHSKVLKSIQPFLLTESLEVRAAFGGYLRSLSERRDQSFYQEVKEPILEIFKTSSRYLNDSMDIENLEEEDNMSEIVFLSAEKAKEFVLHKARSWLENGLFYYKNVLEGCKFTAGSLNIDSIVFDALQTARVQASERTRAQAYDLAVTLLKVAKRELLQTNLLNLGLLIAEGLAERTNEARLFASKASVDLIELAVEFGTIERVLVSLFPRVSLNRFHPFDGISTINKNTWNHIFGGTVMKGRAKELLTKLTTECIEFYLLQLNETNGDVQIAACSSIEDLFKNSEAKAKLASLVPQVLEALFELVKDPKAAVSDHSFNAMGTIISENPAECASFSLAFLRVGFNNLCFGNDKPPDAAAAFIKTLFRAYKDLEKEITKKMDDYILMIKNPSTEVDIDTDSYPKGRKMKPQNWEISLGGIVLASQMIDVLPEEIENFSAKIIDIVTSQEGTTANELRKRGWRILGDLYIRIPKISIRNHFTPVVSTWVKDFTSSDKLLSDSATYFIKQLSRKVPVSVLKSKVDIITSDNIELAATKTL